MMRAEAPMKKVLTPRRETTALPKGAKPPSAEEKSAEIARGRREMVARIKKRFPNVVVLGILGKGEILVELPDDPDLLARLKRELGLESGPAPDEPMPRFPPR
jgi:hypothetical protein